MRQGACASDMSSSTSSTLKIIPGIRDSVLENRLESLNPINLGRRAL